MAHHGLPSPDSPPPQSRKFFLSKPSVLLLIVISLFVIPLVFQLQSPVFRQWGVNILTVHRRYFPTNCSLELDPLLAKLRASVTFLPLKDLRFASTATEGHTWFISSLNDTYASDEAEHLSFPSNASDGRLLCLLGRDRSDGGRNSYSLAWPGSLPRGSRLLEGLTFVSDSYYDYGNIWHGSTAMVPFVGWHVRRGCAVPARWVLYYRGELRLEEAVAPWVRKLMAATFGEEMRVEGLEGGGPACLEKAVVFRHNLGRMGKARRLEAYETMRCKARAYCNVSRSTADSTGVRVTLLLRTGARSFKNESGVVRIFERECADAEGCRLTVAKSDELSFCQQVKLLSETDVLASPHGAQLTNIFFMDRNSSVMEFFPKGWLETAGVGQYVYHWLADWSGMAHQGAWRDPDGRDCPDPSKRGECFDFYKPGQIGHNETQLSGWIKDVLPKAKNKSSTRREEGRAGPNQIAGCACTPHM
ncbi:hypothetical protein ACLOJK_016415 [Asimina triloba]